MKKLFYYLSKLFRNGRAEEQLDDELRFHLQMSMEKKMEAGMSKEEARQEALRDFGGIEQMKEETREGWGFRIVQETIRDIRYALRQMGKHKIFTLVTLLTLTICVGANTAVFSLLHTILLRPYNFPEPDRVVNIGKQWRNSDFGDAVLGFSPRCFLDIKETAKSYESVGFADLNKQVDLRTSDRIQRAEYAVVTPEIWDVTRVKPVIGRLFTQEDIDKGDTNQVILSYRSWKRLYNKSPSAIGSTIALDEKTHTIIGVLPKNFYLRINNTELWLPKIFSKHDRSEKSRQNNSYTVFARLKPDVNLLQAQHELEAIYAAYLDLHPERREKVERSGENYGVLLSKDYTFNMVPMVNAMFWSMQGAGAMILLIGFLNISCLILVRNYHRLSELAMRHSLGASKQRITRQLATETLLLFFTAGILSLPLTQNILSILDSNTLNTMPTGLPTRLNTTVLSTIFLTLLCFGIFFGILPAWSVLKKGLSSSLRNGKQNSSISKRVHWLQNLFVISQISISVILLVTTGVLLKNVNHLLKKEFGYATENRLFVKIPLPFYRYDDARSKIDPFRHQALKDLGNLPGVAQVAFAERQPLDILSTTQTSFAIEGIEVTSADPDLNGTHYRISPGYFETMQIQLRQGRRFTQRDTAENQPVAIISQSIIRDYKPKGELLGRTLTFWNKEYTIIGVVEDTKDYPFYIKEPRHTIYFPAVQWGYNGSVNFVIHTKLSSRELEQTIRKTILEIDPELPEITFVTIKDAIRSGMVAQRMPAEVLACVAFVAIALSLLGLYGVLSYSVSERKREFGIRMALGESPLAITTRILWWGNRLTFIGLAIGITGAYALMRFVDNLLPDIQTTALDTFFFTSLLVIFTTLLAVAIPARQAALTDPMKVLRTE